MFQKPTLYVISVLGALLLGGVFYYEYQEGNVDTLTTYFEMKLLAGAQLTGLSSLWDDQIEDPYKKLAKSNPNSPAGQASTYLDATRITYFVSDDLDEDIKKIRAFKAIAADPRVGRYFHAYARLQIVLLYQYTSHEKAVLDEIFKDEPYKSKIVLQDDGTMYVASSLRGILLSSYQDYKLYRTAIAIAQSFMTQEVYRELRGLPMVPGSLNDAEAYLKQAEARFKTQAMDQPEGSDRNDNYFIDRAAVFMMLGHFKQGTYATDYRQAYEDAIGEITRESPDNEYRIGDLAYAHVQYAYGLLTLDGNKKDAAAHLMTAIKLADSDPKPSIDHLINWIKAARLNDPSLVSLATFKALTDFSPEFKKYVYGLK